ncbi:5'/3'-nucleotidase SurE [bacterium AH-315-C07]|nr:5'/3'-nucleotidase SurE [bacterium AH-315-C07]
MAERTILVTNDDGIYAPGLIALVEVMQQLGKVLVIAPDKPRSGMGHAITIHDPIRLEKINFKEGVEAYKCSGTPVDCVKLATNQVIHNKPDLCVSGINHGANSSINVIYSGTMSAAIEGAIEHIPSIGFSLLSIAEDVDLSITKKYVKAVTEAMLANEIEKDICLNVNIPVHDVENIQGIKICRQANARWEEEFEVRKDPTGKTYYWLTGKFANYDKGTDTDEWALSNNYVSVVPVQYDLTAHHTIAKLNDWSFNEI